MAVNPAAMRRRARIMRAVNVPMRAVLSLPVATPLSSNLMLISYTGRKSGKAYRQPVSYARDGELLLTPGGGRWTLNLAGGRPVRIRLRGREMPARADLVTDAAEVERLRAQERLLHRALAAGAGRRLGVGHGQGGGDLGSGVDAQPGEDLAYVILDGLHRDVQVTGDLLVGLARGHGLRDG